MSESIITISALTAGNVQQFKNELLNQATAQIWDIYSSVVRMADEKNREIARILSTVKTEKAYEDDGFKSVAEYAEKTFGIKRQNAYALASAGDVYNDEKASDALKAFSASKLAELASVDREKVEAAVTDGKIKPETSQKELREFAKSVKGETKKAVVVPTYKIKSFSAGFGPTALDEVLDEVPRTMEEWEEDLPKALYVAVGGSWECVKLPKAAIILPNGEEAPKKTVNRRVLISRTMAPAYFEFEEFTKKPAFLAGATTKEDMLKLLQAMDAADLESLMQAMAGSKTKSKRRKDKDDE